MPHRPLARRAARLAPAFTAAIALSACRSGSFKISPISEGMTAETLLGCVAEVAELNGLPVIEQHAEAPEPTLLARSAPTDSAVQVGDVERVATPRRMDVLTVSFRELGRGLRVLAQTFVLRPGAQPAAAALVRPASNGGAAPVAERADDGTLWHATAPSLRVAEARDEVLARCGSLRS